jgi:hypothetical protein
MDGSEVRQQDTSLTTRTGTKRRRETSQEWETLARWKDGSTTLITLKGLKDLHPLKLAEYAILYERNRIIRKVDLKYWLQSRKFVIKMTNVTQALLSKIENGGVL